MEQKISNALRDSNFDEAKRLIGEIESENRIPILNKVFMEACYFSRLQAVDFLLKNYNIDLNKINCLHCVIGLRHSPELLNFLLQHGANTEIENERGENCLLYSLSVYNIYDSFVNPLFNLKDEDGKYVCKISKLNNRGRGVLDYLIKTDLFKPQNLERYKIAITRFCEEIKDK